MLRSPDTVQLQRRPTARWAAHEVGRLADFPYETRRCFSTAVVDAGRSVSEFKVAMLVFEPGADPAQAVLAVTVSHIASGLSRTYEALEVVGWVYDFKRDLRAGAFGPPAR